MWLARRELEALIIEQTEREYASLRMRGQVLAEMNHAFLTDRIGLPELERFQLTTAAAILQTAGCSQDETELVSTVLLLVYHGLSVHEQIDQPHSDVQSRQLKVLAGDYYSSKFFYLLAADGKIELIGLFAEAIARVNEAKAEKLSLFKQPVSTDKYLSLSERIEGELLYVLCSHYLHSRPEINDIVRLLVRTHVLGIEYNRFLSGHYAGNLSEVYIRNQATEDELRLLSSNPSYLQDAKIMPIHVKYGTSAFLYERLEVGLMTARSLLKLQDSQTVAERFFGICDDLGQLYLQPRRIVEER
ncbi:heptaprenyl diphosphate synthase component 1 [Effusibacillus pohliae]|uniref:heptaprenyl diphosphate synthase component 1 n=1 Tax=Effusibacillus pohliae TaxID=232270 RepID=UPI00039D77DD|nr:heptaprenyl diphosphate synthase component 1 [Effusibacillus pohliae]